MSPPTSDPNEFRELAREPLDAEAAYRFAPTLENTSRLGWVRQRLATVLEMRAQRRTAHW